jgi:hypothetical protein
MGPRASSWSWRAAVGRHDYMCGSARNQHVADREYTTQRADRMRDASKTETVESHTEALKYTGAQPNSWNRKDFDRCE